MKKMLCVLMCAVLLLTFAGCGTSTEQNTAQTAVDTRIVEAIAKPQAEVMTAFGLTEEDTSEMWPGVYVTELNWYGMPMETEFGFFEDVCVSASAKAALPDDENTLKLMQDCLTMLENQFNAPYRYDYIDLYGEDSLSTSELPDRETVFETFSESTNGGVGFRYSLSGEHDGTGTKAPYVDVSFLRLESEPGNIRITTTLRDVMIK